jgi:branched-chain amino acid aminotransferase
MAFQVYITGRLYSKEDARISVYDHGLLYGDGIFEGMRSYNGRVFRLQQHLRRLWESARSIWLEIPISPEQMAKAVNETLAANGIKDGYIRLVVTRGAGSLGLDPNRCSEPQVIIITDHISLYPKEFYEKGLEIVTAATMRNHPAALNPRIKSLNYLNNILAKIEGLKAGCVEALMLNHKGEVAECTGVIELAAEAGIEVRQTSLTRHDVYVADECFLTGSAAEVIPVVKVDNRVIGSGKPGPVTRDLSERFHRLTRE